MASANPLQPRAKSGSRDTAASKSSTASQSYGTLRVYHFWRPVTYRSQASRSDVPPRYNSASSPPSRASIARRMELDPHLLLPRSVRNYPTSRSNPIAFPPPKDIDTLLFGHGILLLFAMVSSPKA